MPQLTSSMLSEVHVKQTAKKRHTSYIILYTAILHHAAILHYITQLLTLYQVIVGTGKPSAEQVTTIDCWSVIVTLDGR